MKKKNHVINSTDGEKALTNATSIPEKKTSQQTWNRKELLNLIKDLYENPTVNINLDGGKTECFILLLR